MSDRNRLSQLAATWASRVSISWLQDAAWGLIAGLAAFLAILVGILTADKEPTSVAWFAAVIAAFAASGVSVYQAKQSRKQEKEQDKIRTGLENQKENLKHLLKEQKTANEALEAEQERLALERRRAARSLGKAGRYFIDLSQTGNIRELDALIDFVADSLCATLAEQDPITATFLHCHGNEKFGLPPQSASGQITGVRTACSVRTSKGIGPSADGWHIDEGTADYAVVPRFISRESPWQKGLVIGDTSALDIIDHIVLRMPGTERDAGSLLRMPISVASSPIGILCLDSEKVGALDRKIYDEVVTPFARTIEAGFAIYAMSHNGNSGNAGGQHG
jgi:hypothetical protein